MRMIESKNLTASASMVRLPRPITPIGGSHGLGRSRAFVGAMNKVYLHTPFCASVRLSSR